MSISIDVEHQAWAVLPEAVVTRAIAAVLPNDPRGIDVLLTSDAEIRVLNREWRGQDKPTNILSFPAPDMPVPPGEAAHLGDLVLGFETVAREATAANKPLPDHVTHLVVHGVLHLLGHDHEQEDEAEAMETMERNILAKLGLPDPYLS